MAYTLNNNDDDDDDDDTILALVCGNKETTNELIQHSLSPTGHSKRGNSQNKAAMMDLTNSME
jgi:hypothetical protein